MRIYSRLLLNKFIRIGKKKEKEESPLYMNTKLNVEREQKANEIQNKAGNKIYSFKRRERLITINTITTTTTSPTTSITNTN